MLLLWLSPLSKLFLNLFENNRFLFDFEHIISLVFQIHKRLRFSFIEVSSVILSCDLVDYTSVTGSSEENLMDTLLM